MAKDTPYRHVLVETYMYAGGGSKHQRRLRPLPGQGLDTKMAVECSSKMRDSHPVGTIFKIEAKITDREGSPPFLYTHHTWPYEVLSRQDADAYIGRRNK